MDKNSEGKHLYAKKIFPIYSEIVARNIRTLRLQKEISKKEIAGLLNCSYSAYCRLESGETELIHEKLSKAAEILNTDVVKLLSTNVTQNHTGQYSGDHSRVTTLNEHSIAVILQIKDETIAILKDKIQNLKDQINRKDIQIEQLLLRENK